MHHTLKYISFRNVRRAHTKKYYCRWGPELSKAPGKVQGQSSIMGGGGGGGGCVSGEGKWLFATAGTAKNSL